MKSFAAAEGAIGIAEKANKVQQETSPWLSLMVLEKTLL